MKNRFEKSRDYALYFTMAMAIILGVLWALSGFQDPEVGATATAFWIVFYLLCTGGVVMGILYVIHLLGKRGK